MVAADDVDGGGGGLEDFGDGGFLLVFVFEEVEVGVWVFVDLSNDQILPFQTRQNHYRRFIPQQSKTLPYKYTSMSENSRAHLMIKPPIHQHPEHQSPLIHISHNFSHHRNTDSHPLNSVNHSNKFY